jgi:hypothetical protein
MSRGSGFDPFREHPFRGKLRILILITALLLVVLAPRYNVEPTAGASGDFYHVYDEREIWRVVGPVFSVRFRTEHRTRSLVQAEAEDLLPPIAARADSAGLRYVIIRANRPIARLGHRFGLYRGWNFRYQRAPDGGWISSGYW